MHIFYTLMVAAAIAAAPPAQAALTVLSTGFNDVAALSGWLYVNQSAPAGTPWFQGNGGIFAAQAGGENAYAAANFLSAADGNGTIDNWLITPQLSLPGAATLSFYTRSAATPGFSDQLEIRYSTSGASPADFSQLLLTVGGASPYPAQWQQYTLAVDPGASVRFAFRYTGAAAQADYIGLDTLVVNAVPEPAQWLLLAAGGMLILHSARRAAQQAGASPGTASCTGRRRCWPPTLLPRLLAAAALIAAADAATATGQEGMIVVRDAETGAMRPATPAEFAALRAQQPRAPGRFPPLTPEESQQAPQVQQRSDGTRQSRVTTRAVYAVATRGADGALSHHCVPGAQAADAALSSAGAAVSTMPDKEHRHAHRKPSAHAARCDRQPGARLRRTGYGASGRSHRHY